MRIGICLDFRNPPGWARPWSEVYAAMLDLAEQADDWGIDEIWTTEHHFFEDGYLPQPLTMCAALAARTSRARIGTAITIAPLRPATQLAEDAAVIDAISNGRFDLGLGAGYRQAEFDAFDADLPSRFHVLDQRAREVRELLADDTLTPRPVQDELPIWLGYFAAAGARRAARMGAGLLSLLPETVTAYRDELSVLGRPPGTGAVAGLVNAVVADDPDEVWDVIGQHLSYQLDSYGRYAVEGTGVPAPPAPDPADIRAAQVPPEAVALFPHFAVFTPAQAVDRLRSLAPADMNSQAFFWGSIAGMPDAIATRHVELLATQVRPAVADL